VREVWPKPVDRGSIEAVACEEFFRESFDTVIKRYLNLFLNVIRILYSMPYLPCQCVAGFVQYIGLTVKRDWAQLDSVHMVTL
jgi:hypothetical protein